MLHLDVYVNPIENANWNTTKQKERYRQDAMYPGMPMNI